MKFFILFFLIIISCKQKSVEVDENKIEIIDKTIPNLTYDINIKDDQYVAFRAIVIQNNGAYSLHPPNGFKCAGFLWSDAPDKVLNKSISSLKDGESLVVSIKCKVSKLDQGGFFQSNPMTHHAFIVSESEIINENIVIKELHLPNTTGK